MRDSYVSARAGGSKGRQHFIFQIDTLEFSLGTSLNCGEKKKKLYFYYGRGVHAVSVIISSCEISARLQYVKLRHVAEFVSVVSSL